MTFCDTPYVYTQPDFLSLVKYWESKIGKCVPTFKSDKKSDLLSNYLSLIKNGLGGQTLVRLISETLFNNWLWS